MLCDGGGGIWTNRDAAWQNKPGSAGADIVANWRDGLSYLVVGKSASGLASITSRRSVVQCLRS